MEKAGLEFVVACEPLSDPVYVDREMWEKIVLNLISNAFKFTLDGQVTVSRDPRRTSVVLVAVADTGVGIPEHELPRVFERFHRVEGSQGRSHEGSGIGLALVQELVKLHGGELDGDQRAGARQHLHRVDSAGVRASATRARASQRRVRRAVAVPPRRTSRKRCGGCRRIAAQL